MRRRTATAVEGLLRQSVRIIAATGAALAITLGVGSAAVAHDRTATAITVTATESGDVEVVATIPAAQLQAARAAEGAPDDPLETLVEEDAVFDQYVLDRVSLSLSGTPIALYVTQASLADDVVSFTLVGSADGLDLSEVALTWNLVVVALPTQYALVSAASWPVTEDNRVVVGEINHSRPTLTFSLAGVLSANHATAFEAGFEHFRTGLDHVTIMLILAIGLAAPWATPRVASAGANTWKSLMRLAVLTSLSFAIGHSISLVLVATTSLRLPSSVIEVAIAVTIGLGAVHSLAASRGKVAPRLGYAPVGLIGLIHGFGFASALDSIGVTQGNLTWSILGFNAGLEAAQLLALAIFVPLLVFLGNARAFRTALLAAITGLSVLWVADRVGFSWLGRHLPLEGFGYFNVEIISAVMVVAALCVRAFALPDDAPEASKVSERDAALHR